MLAEWWKKSEYTSEKGTHVGSVSPGYFSGGEILMLFSILALSSQLAALPFTLLDHIELRAFCQFSPDLNYSTAAYASVAITTLLLPVA